MKTSSIVLLVAGLALPAVASAQLVRSGAGATKADIQAIVDTYRADLGTLNPFTPGSVGTGRREVNWDGVPDTATSPNPFPGNFFNGTATGRARGILFSTPGASLQVSASAASGAGIEFDNIDPSYSSIFGVFSAQKLFTAIGSTINEVEFRVPGDNRRALTRGFGVVFTDVDAAGKTSMELYDERGLSLGKYAAPVGPTPSESLSFIGVSFDSPIVAKVRIISGDTMLGAGVLEDASRDLVVMDDFIYGEPVKACLADCNGDTYLDVADFTCFQNQYALADMTKADCNGDGALNIQDFTCFQNEFALGCPR